MIFGGIYQRTVLRDAQGARDGAGNPNSTGMSAFCFVLTTWRTVVSSGIGRVI